MHFHCLIKISSIKSTRIFISPSLLYLKLIISRNKNEKLNYIYLVLLPKYLYKQESSVLCYSFLLKLLYITMIIAYIPQSIDYVY